MANQPAVKAATKPKGEGVFKRFGKFARESYIETCHKSSWPTWPELRGFTIVVIFAIVAVSAWIGSIDFVLTQVTDQISRSGR